ncbi:MAG: hypothetical protein ACRCWQ_05835 [Bacilli bacterium]
MPNRTVIDYVVANDRYAQWITDTKQFVDNAIHVGEKSASHYIGADFHLLFRESGYDVCVVDESNAHLRAEMVIEKNRRWVRVYSNSVQQLYEQYKHLYTKQQIQNMHFAHEWFHVLESEGKIPFDEKWLYANQKLWCFTRKVKVQAYIELCAHAFVKTVCEMKELPVQFDYSEIQEA